MVYVLRCTAAAPNTAEVEPPFAALFHPQHILSVHHRTLRTLMGECTMAVLALVGNYVFGFYMGDAGIGAFGIACYYTPFVFMIGNAVAQSAQPIVSFNYGSGDSRRVRSTLHVALLTAFACGLAVSGAFVLLPQQLVELFVNSSEAAFPLAVNGFPLIAVSFVFFIINLTCIGYFQSIERVRPAMVFALLRGLLLLVPSFIALPLLLGENGIWLALALSEMLTTLGIAGYSWWCCRHA